MGEEIKLIEVKEGILAENAKTAKKNRDKLSASGTFMLNIMSSPGSGKTSLILNTAKRLEQSFAMGVIEADIDSTVDAQKVAQAGLQVLQLKTGGFCHLDANMVARALDASHMQGLDILFLENVGNLVCPAEFDTGSSMNVMLLSIPEGDDKPLKYPLMFSACQALIVNKTDYMQLDDFNIDLLQQRVQTLNPDIKIFPVSCRTGQGLDSWVQWLTQRVQEYKQDN